MALDNKINYSRNSKSIPIRYTPLGFIETGFRNRNFSNIEDLLKEIYSEYQIQFQCGNNSNQSKEMKKRILKRYTHALDGDRFNLNKKSLLYSLVKKVRRGQKVAILSNNASIVTIVSFLLTAGLTLEEVTRMIWLDDIKWYDTNRQAGIKLDPDKRKRFIQLIDKYLKLLGQVKKKRKLRINYFDDRQGALQGLATTINSLGAMIRNKNANLELANYFVGLWVTKDFQVKSSFHGIKFSLSSQRQINSDDNKQNSNSDKNASMRNDDLKTFSGSNNVNNTHRLSQNRRHRIDLHRGSQRYTSIPPRNRSYYTIADFTEGLFKLTIFNKASVVYTVKPVVDPHTKEPRLQ